MEQLLKSHESNSKRNLQSIKGSLSRFTQKLESCKREMFGEIGINIRDIKSQLQTLFALKETNGDIKAEQVETSIIFFLLKFN